MTISMAKAYISTLTCSVHFPTEPTARCFFISVLQFQLWCKGEGERDQEDHEPFEADDG